MSKFQETCLSLLKATLHSLHGVLRELAVPDNHLMELISEKISALSSAMTIINGEKAASWPEIDLLKFGLDNVEDD